MILIIKYVRFVIKNVESDTKYCFLLILFQISFTQNPDYANFANGIVFSEKICIVLHHFGEKKMIFYCIGLSGKFVPQKI